jgi:hypothetical protein
MYFFFPIVRSIFKERSKIRYETDWNPQSMSNLEDVVAKDVA